MSRGLKVSLPTIANMIPFVNISDFKWLSTIILTFAVGDWDTLDDSLAL
jgi:hypothetical protein